MSSTERRRTPRTASRLSMVLSDQTREMATRTENISASGANCVLTKCLPLMTKLEIRLELPLKPRAKRITCRGVVVRVNPPTPSPKQATYQTAIFFHDVSERDRSALDAFIQQHLQPNA